MPARAQDQSFVLVWPSFRDAFYDQASCGYWKTNHCRCHVVQTLPGICSDSVRNLIAQRIEPLPRCHHESRLLPSHAVERGVRPPSRGSGRDIGDRAHDDEPISLSEAMLARIPRFDPPVPPLSPPSHTHHQESTDQLLHILREFQLDLSSIRPDQA